MSSYSTQQPRKRAKLLQERAHSMRQALSPAEARLWEALSGAQLGTPFRRRVVLGGRYIADFLAARERLVVEVDGEQHAACRTADARRDRVLARLRYRTLRIPAATVHADLKTVLQLIRVELER